MDLDRAEVRVVASILWETGVPEEMVEPRGQKQNTTAHGGRVPAAGEAVMEHMRYTKYFCKGVETSRL